MNKYEIFKIIEEILELKEGTVNENSIHKDFKNWDSLGALTIVVALQEKYESIKTIPDDCVFKSVKDILKFYGI